jgi:hypothetical protein
MNWYQLNEDKTFTKLPEGEYPRLGEFNEATKQLPINPSAPVIIIINFCDLCPKIENIRLKPKYFAVLV